MGVLVSVKPEEKWTLKLWYIITGGSAGRRAYCAVLGQNDGTIFLWYPLHMLTLLIETQLGFKKKKESLEIQFICVLDSGMSNRALQRIPLHLCHSHNSITLLICMKLCYWHEGAKVLFFCKPYTVLFNIPHKKQQPFSSIIRQHWITVCIKEL